ncbi:hypothetical protein NPIL_610251 [Nephila pilipes]|uniref:Uncharacterized protein n=1 Tax=Nephila pilipes TaxID=299642 RepID=A0A8X6NE34_NEPPI|nr:hypothetical protein NPIL_610251 [Nephila pilipes]
MLSLNRRSQLQMKEHLTRTMDQKFAEVRINVSVSVTFPELHQSPRICCIPKKDSGDLVNLGKAPSVRRNDPSHNARRVLEETKEGSDDPH